MMVHQLRGGGEYVVETPELLGALCRELPELRAVAAESGDSAALEETLAAARRGEPVVARLAELGLLRLLEAPMPRQVPQGPTVPASPPPGGGLVPLPGADHSGRVPIGRYRCPTAACHRAELPRPGADLPVCALQGRSLRFA
jgi:hypothetical protein